MYLPSLDQGYFQKLFSAINPDGQQADPGSETHRLQQLLKGSPFTTPFYLTLTYTGLPISSTPSPCRWPP